MTIQDAYKQLSLSLQSVYERREATNIAGIVIENLTGFSNTGRIIHKHDDLNENQLERFYQISTDLLSHKPIQYVLHEAYWCGMKLYVDESVLIPRPETEELAALIMEDISRQQSAISKQPSVISLLDIGTGSGCIAIAIKKNRQNAEVCATDISDNALRVARRNAEEQQTDIHFSAANILDEQQWNRFSEFDYIVSNPPYIAMNEAAFMNDNVLKYEPHDALFVTDENPLLFYDAIASFGLLHLKAGGKLFFEINEAFGNETAELLRKKNYTNVQIKKDLQGKNRMIKAEKTTSIP